MEPSGGSADPVWFEEIDHTGDVGIRVTASSIEEVFVRAAWGMFAVLTDMHAVQVHETRRLAVEAPDREALLVEWLSELQYIHSTEYMLFCDFAIEQFEESALRAVVGGEPVDSERHTVYTEIKAITYHGLAISRTGDGWEAQVIFDM